MENNRFHSYSSNLLNRAMISRIRARRYNHCIGNA
jgi:hypothetical protein